MKKIIIVAFIIQAVLLFAWVMDPNWWAISRQKTIAGKSELSFNLSDRNVTCFEQDADSKMWIGTSDGLNIYDGMEYRQFFHDREDSTTIPDDNITTLHRDRKGIIWVGSYGGVCRYEGAGHFRTFRQIQALSGNGIKQISDGPDGSVFVNNSTKVYRISGDTVTVFHTFRNAYPTNLFFLGENGSFWTACEEKLTHYDKHGRRLGLKTTAHANLNYYYQHGDTAWVTLSRCIIGIDLRRDKLFYQKDLPILPTSFYALNNHTLYVSSQRHGLFSLDIHNDSLKKVLPEYLRLHHKDVMISTFFRDHSDNMWVGFFDGLFQIVSPLIPQQITPFGNDLRRNLAGKEIYRIGCAGEGIFGSTDDSLFYYRPMQGITIYSYYDLFTDSPYYRQEPSDFVPIDDSHAWIISNVRILSCLLNGGRIIVLNRVFSREHLGPTLGVGVRVGNEVFVTSTSPYLLRSKFGSDSCDSIPVRDNCYNSNSRLVKLPDGRLLVVMRDLHVAVYSPKTGRVKPINVNGENKTQGIEPTSVLVSQGKVWIGTRRSGIYSFDLQTKALKRTADVAIKEVRSIAKGQGNALWICSRDGVMVYEPTTHASFFYPTTSVISGDWRQNIYLRKVFYEPRRRAMVLATSKGCFVLPDLKGGKTEKPKLQVIYISIRREADKECIIEEGIENGSHFTFSCRDNDLTLRFSCSNYGNSRHYLYQYWLEGRDNAWQMPQMGQTAHFADLKPGNYTFHVRLISSPELPPLSERFVRITIKSSLLTSWAAIYFYLMIAVGILLYINHLYLRMRTSRMRWEQVRHERERDQHTNEMNMSFFANISHEFRNPLTLIAGPLMVLRDDRNLPGAERRMLKMVCKSVNRMLRLIDQMLDFNKLETDALKLRVSECDVSNELKSVVSLVAESARLRHVSLETKGLGGNVYGWIDKDKVEKVMSNLLTNALKHVPDGGLISVEMGMTEAGSQSELERRLPDETGRIIFVKVYNNGDTIDPDKLPNVFYRYYQAGNTSRNHQYGWGTGIGLYYVKRLIGLHHGDVWVRNEPQGGVTFLFMLPIDATAYEGEEFVGKGDGIMQIPVEPDTDVESKVENNSIDVNAMAKKPVVLIVDDDTDVAQYVRSIFAADFVVVNRYSAEAALADIDNIRPDIVLSDVVMDEMSGYDLCRKLKRDIGSSHIPIVLITAKSTVDEQVEGLDVGADAYVTKPFDPRYLRALVSNLLKKSEWIRKLLSEGQPADIPEGELSEQDRKFMEDLYALMEKHLSEQSLNVSTISRELLISHSKFNYKLKELTGETPGSFFRKFKLNRAAHLLREGKYNVSEVAMHTGFGTISYFSVAFKKQFGVCPSEYK